MASVHFVAARKAHRLQARARRALLLHVANVGDVVADELAGEHAGVHDVSEVGVAPKSSRPMGMKARKSGAATNILPPASAAQ